MSRHDERIQVCVPVTSLNVVLLGYHRLSHNKYFLFIKPVKYFRFVRKKFSKSFKRPEFKSSFSFWRDGQGENGAAMVSPRSSGRRSFEPVFSDDLSAPVGEAAAQKTGAAFSGVAGR